MPQNQAFQQIHIALPRIKQEDYSPHIILRTFDRLLPLYKYVEGQPNAEPLQTIGTQAFAFVPGSFERIVSTSYTQKRRVIDVNLRHILIQSALFERLCGTHGPDNVAPEHASGVGTRIDIVVRAEDRYWFYEVKMGNTARACIREALGQLMEYSFWPGSQNAERLIVVGEPPFDPDAVSYLAELRVHFALPIEYEQQEIT